MIPSKAITAAPFLGSIYHQPSGMIRDYSLNNYQMMPVRLTTTNPYYMQQIARPYGYVPIGYGLGNNDGTSYGRDSISTPYALDQKDDNEIPTGMAEHDLVPNVLNVLPLVGRHGQQYRINTPIHPSSYRLLNPPVVNLKDITIPHSLLKPKILPHHPHHDHIYDAVPAKNEKANTVEWTFDGFKHQCTLKTERLVAKATDHGVKWQLTQSIDCKHNKELHGH